MNDQKIDCQRAEAPGEKGFAGVWWEASGEGRRAALETAFQPRCDRFTLPVIY